MRNEELEKILKHIEATERLLKDGMSEDEVKRFDEIRRAIEKYLLSHNDGEVSVVLKIQ